MVKSHQLRYILHLILTECAIIKANRSRRCHTVALKHLTEGYKSDVREIIVPGFSLMQPVTRQGSGENYEYS